VPGSATLNLDRWTEFNAGAADGAAGKTRDKNAGNQQKYDFNSHGGLNLLKGLMLIFRRENAER
jgi:hypothetical protein